MPRSLYADDNSNFAYLGRGISRLLTAPFQMPRYLIEGTLSGPPLLGTVGGALKGTLYTVSSVLNGTLDIARGAVPYAKYAAPFLLL